MRINLNVTPVSSLKRVAETVEEEELNSPDDPLQNAQQVSFLLMVRLMFDVRNIIILYLYPALASS